MTDLSERWDFLRPWCAPLRGKLDLHFTELNRVPVKRYPGISVCLPVEQEDMTPAKLRAIRDALVLLAMVARADHGSWKHVLRAHCEFNLDALLTYQETEGFRHARFKTILTVTGDNEDRVAGMLKDFFSDLDAPPRGDFAVTAKRILGNCALRTADSGSLEIPITLMLETAPGRHMTPRWESIQRVLGELRRERSDWRFPVNVAAVGHTNVPFECAIVLQPLEVELFGDYLTLAEAKAVLEMLGSGDGLPISHLGIMPQIQRKLAMDPARAAQTIGRLLEHVFCASSCPPGTVPAIEDVDLSWVLREVAPVGRLCSALVESRTTNKLRLSLEPLVGFDDSRAEVWAYVAYALFSKQAKKRSSITHVALSEARLTAEDADAMAAVLASGDPVAHLFGHRESDGDDAGNMTSATAAAAFSSTSRWMLKKGAAVTLLPMHPDDAIQTESATWTLEADVAGVKVLPCSEGQQELQRANVVVPGYGVCEVTRDQLVPVDGGDDSTAKRSRGGVTSLELSYVTAPHGGEGVHRFFELIGASLTRLQLSSYGLDLDVARLMRACPNLETLIIDKIDVDADDFVKAYNDNKMRITELDCQFDNLSRITAELKDKRTRLARTLKRLAYKSLEHWSYEEEEHLETVAPMLEVNKTLEYVELTVPREVFTHQALAMRSYHNMRLPVAQEPFPLACRLAFLSIFGAGRRQSARDFKRAKRGTTPESSVLTTFPVEAHVMSIIFGFAAECVRRRVYYNAWDASDW